MEIFVMIVSTVVTVSFLSVWYNKLLRMWPPSRNKTAKFVLGFVPVAAFYIFLHTLRFMASFDVVNNVLFIVFYVLLGFLCMGFGMMMMTYTLDLSWKDDAVNLNNRAAIFAIAGGYLGMAMIYAGANIGDGPGWWCVVFAGGLGFVAWLVLARQFNAFSYVIERITVERDLAAGIRFGSYLLASGIILGRASAGDWTSFWMTVVEFLDGWPVILLTLLAVWVERTAAQKASFRGQENAWLGSVVFGVLYLLLAVGSVTLLPELPINPIYGGGAQ